MGTFSVASQDYPRMRKSTYPSSFNNELDPPIEEFSPTVHNISLVDGSLNSSHNMNLNYVEKENERYHLSDDYDIDDNFEDISCKVGGQVKQHVSGSTISEKHQPQEYGEDR